MIEILCDEIADRLRVVGDNRKKFIQLHPLNRFVNQQCFCYQTENRTKTGQGIENQESKDDNDEVGHQQGSGDIHRRVFFDNHGDDVRAAAGGIFEKQQCRR